MKHLNKIVVWSLLSLSIQLAGLFYIDKYYLKSDIDNLKIKKIEKKEEKKSTVDIAIPENVANAKVSYDGKYVSYTEGEYINVINTSTGDKKDINGEEGFAVTYYSWLSDRNRVIMGEKSSKGNKLIISLFDLDKNEKKIMKEIAAPDSNSSIDDIACSVQTGVTYAKVKNSGGRYTVYRIDRMNDMEKIALKSSSIEHIAVLPHDDKFIYEDMNNKKINVTGMKNTISIEGVVNYKILGVDEEDRLYVGDMDGEKIKRIFYGSLNDSTDKWSKIDLPNSLNKEDIFISGEGKIYVNDNLKGVVNELVSGKETTYEGRLFHMYNGGIGSISQGKLVRTKL